MNYFIDFEATQFSNEIISIGCIREDGKRFYSLCQPVKGKLTSFITNLTGITQEMICDAASVDEAFSKFHDWLMDDESTESSTFYTWGSNDRQFVQSTYNTASAMKAKMTLSYLYYSIKDYSGIFSKLLGQNNHMSLINAYHIINPEYSQTHNALDDANMLYEIWKAIQRNEIPIKNIKLVDASCIEASELLIKPLIEKSYTACNFDIGTVCIVTRKTHYPIKTFPRLKDAYDWLWNTKMTSKQREKRDYDKYKNNFIESVLHGKFMMDCNWRICIDSQQYCYCEDDHIIRTSIPIKWKDCNLESGMIAYISNQGNCKQIFTDKDSAIDWLLKWDENFGLELNRMQIEKDLDMAIVTHRKYRGGKWVTVN